MEAHLAAKFEVEKKYDGKCGEWFFLFFMLLCCVLCYLILCYLVVFVY